MKILIFKTNIDDDRDCQQVTFFLNNHPHITKWSIDKEDVDKVLRIESKHNITDNIIKALQEAGFVCHELI